MEKFIKKQDQINRALAKVECKIESMRKLQDSGFYDKYEILTEEQRNWWRREIDSWKWNSWTDLKDRLTDRLLDNYRDYCDWHFQEHGWVSI